MSLLIKNSNIFRASLKLVNLKNNSTKIFCNNFQFPIKLLSTSANKSITVYFIDRDGDKKTVKAKLGSNLLDVAIDNNLDLEGFGACEGTLSCSTCHLILNKENYDKLKPPSDEENDMLDLAFGLCDTSRLGCQIIVNESMEGWTFVVPKEVADARNE